MTRLYSLDVRSSLVSVPIAGAKLEGLLSIPDGARSLIIFAQGRGSSRQNAVDTFLATEFQHAGFATLLMDLYTPAELEEDSQDAHLRFRTDMLAHRLEAVTDWSIHSTMTHQLACGFMAASTGAAAAIVAAANRPDIVLAVAARAGRPDLAGESLGSIRAAVMLVVGGNDHLVAEFNQIAIRHMPAGTNLTLLPGVGHDFAEAGALETLALQTVNFFTEHLPANLAL